MHNRLKVRTSAELQAIKKKDEEAKAAQYKSCFSQLLDMRRKNEYNETLLVLAAEILRLNPDVSTVWNIRKEYLSKLKENTDESNDASAIVDTELKLTEAGLRINPKSYCAWYHRCWVLNNFGNETNWNYELKIVSKLLEEDDRNFHCWDYRKYIVERLQTPLQKEFDYTLQKLNSNFSNYSAWHYRSKLILKLHCPYEQLFRNEIFQKEVKLVQKAAYTEPRDQSAWFYYNWLLGSIPDHPRFVQGGHNKSTGLAWVVVSPSVPCNRIKGLGTEEWRHLNENKRSNVYIKKLKMDHEFWEIITLHDENDEIIDSFQFFNGISIANAAEFSPALEDREKVDLEKQLSSWLELSGFELDVKWPLLAIVTINRKLKANDEGAAFEMLEILDGYRKNYYNNLIARIRIENALLRVENWQDKFIANGLTALYHNYCFTLFREVDLSASPFGSAVIRYLDVLLSCEVLRLRNCDITSIGDFPQLPNLKILDLSENPLSLSPFPTGLLQCPMLTSIDLTKTSVTFEDLKNAKEKLPHVDVIKD